MGKLAKILNEAPGAKIAEGVRNRILILDVERLPGITKQYWWYRGDLKNRYIHYETVEREPRTTIVCAKWYDSPDVIELAEWDKGGRKKFLKAVHSLLKEADIVVGHNLDQADLPWLRGDMHIEAGLPPLPPFKTVDTLKVLRQEFKSGAPFKSLDAFCQIAGIPSKTDAYDRHAMERAVDGSVGDRERLTAYCTGDILATQGLYDFLRPFIKGHPVLDVDGDLMACNRCGGETKPIEKRYVAQVMSYSMQVCKSCGGHQKLSIAPERISIARGV
ncbi:hypothetical protein [Mycobacterium sp. CnD-18-1]|uniref:hypothetical protein n=1 Tax=Mycobacterium sp. CnD-18-1 TaxID=2917744 RepID=UPI001EF3880F|nr:hypothetical protein [Mycobacterium sp. CnD-18-1]MCG7607120.1 hypothetical protein [Mycobacterium sp. CnD-18-1]